MRQRHVYDLDIMDRMRLGFGSISDVIMGRTPDISDVVYHFTCTSCGKKKKIVVANDIVEPVTGKTHLEMVIGSGNKCVTCCLSEILT
jgi:hypothetical protein